MEGGGIAHVTPVISYQRYLSPQHYSHPRTGTCAASTRSPYSNAQIKTASDSTRLSRLRSSHIAYALLTTGTLSCAARHHTCYLATSAFATAPRPHLRKHAANTPHTFLAVTRGGGRLPAAWRLPLDTGLLTYVGHQHGINNRYEHQCGVIGRMGAYQLKGRTYAP